MLQSPPNPLKTAWVACVVGLVLLSVAALLWACSSAPVALPVLSAVQMCRVMASQPLVMVTNPDLVNLGDLKAMVARLKACNETPDGGT